MNKKLAYILIVLVVLFGAWYLTVNIDKTNNPEISESTFTTFTQNEYGFEFDFLAGEEGYIVEELTPGENGEDFLHAVVMIRSEDVQQLVNIPEGGEGPPGIAMLIFKNTDKQFPLTWAEENIAFSNFNLKQGETVESVVGGANAVRYMADGLYASENVVVAHGDYIYVFTGQFIDAESALRRDFGSMLESVRFIPILEQE